MRNIEWISLTDAERGQLVAIWLLAADHDGVIPASPEMIQKICYMKGKPNISKFIDLGFVCQDGVNMTSGRRQSDTPETEAEAETEKNRIEKKQKKKFEPPTIEDVKQYFIDNGYKPQIGEDAFHYYNVAGWQDSRGKPVKNWKQKMRGVWFKDEHKTEEKRNDDRAARLQRLSEKS